MGQGEPVAMHLKVRGPVAGEEEELQARGGEEAGEEDGECGCGGWRWWHGRAWLVCGVVVDGVEARWG